MNIDLSEGLLETLASWGCEDILICPGARNSPLLMSLDASEGFRLESFFDERSAGFYALGRARLTRRPVAVVTTSGTAVSELLSASVEAFYSQVPLLWITADRPRRFRGTAAPQSIQHLGIFSSYCEKTSDIANAQDLEVFRQEYSSWSGQSPWHVNICFEEPLVDRPVVQKKYQIADISSVCLTQIASENSSSSFARWTQENQKLLKQPLIIVAGLRPDERAPVLQWLKQMKTSVYLETLSGLRGHPDLKEWELQGSDRWLSNQALQGKFHCLVRIGDIPIIRLWRDLEDKLKQLTVFSWSQAAWSGLSRPSEVFPLSTLSEISFPHRDQDMFFQQENLLKEGRQVSERVNAFFEKYPLSEPAWVHRLSKVQGAQRLYLGNSLPVREWDLSSDRTSHWIDCLGNRGANGIDGQISTFLGWQDSNSHSLGFFGDLTALYDLQALWSGCQFRQAESLPRASICVMNNGGGQIFQRMFKKEIFLNQHRLRFQPWAEMFGWKYECLTQTAPSHWQPGCIYEVIPCSEQTQAFWQQMDQYGY